MIEVLGRLMSRDLAESIIEAMIAALDQHDGDADAEVAPAEEDAKGWEKLTA